MPAPKVYAIEQLQERRREPKRIRAFCHQWLSNREEKYFGGTASRAREARRETCTCRHRSRISSPGGRGSRVQDAAGGDAGIHGSPAPRRPGAAQQQATRSSSGDARRSRETAEGDSKPLAPVRAAVFQQPEYEPGIRARNRGE